jgi:ABC-type multidrug transport system ATPase subunit/pSer/pThr/pTyr-binding forkhead associated (FHA) protein
VLSEIMFQLLVIQGPDEGKVFEISDSDILIGRAPDAQVVLSSQVVSRYHARIYFEGDNFFLEDKGSANGTFLNSERVTSIENLKSGDRITLGDKVILEFQTPMQPVNPRETIRLTDEAQNVNRTIVIENGKDENSEQAALAPQTAPLQIDAVEQDVYQQPPTTRPYDDRDFLSYQPEGAPPNIIVTVAGQNPVTYNLDSPQITLGRDADNDIVIQSNIISRHHARLEQSGATYRLVVMPGNTNESYVDGQLVSSEQDLKNNSLIRIGSAQAGQLVTIQYIISTQSEPSRARNIQLGTQAKMLVGRDPSNDIVLEAPPVSRFHAEIERVGQRYRVKDLGSLNGTFVNDLRIEGEVWAKPQDTVRIGPYLFVLGEEELAQIDQTGGLRVDAIGLQKWVKKDLNLLQDISLALKPREFVVVVGQSGGGKTTLVDALAGYRPATQGHVYVNQTDLYRHFDAMRSNIGYVPQRDIIHMELTVYESLDYAAKLRMPPDTSTEERHQRIMEVLEDLDLTYRKDVQINGLSGGQQKRVSIGVELLTKPGLFFLDEPTSGLDPGTETSLMLLMRRLADQGRTIILITHATKNVMLADKVIFLARGGHLAWFGPPDEALNYFAQYQSERERRYAGMDFDQIYAILDDTSKGAPEDWQTRYRQHPAYQQYVLAPLRKQGHDPDVSQPLVVDQDSEQKYSTGPKNVPRSFDLIGAFRQFTILSARNLKILRRDRISLFLMLAAAPLVGMLDFVLASGMKNNPYDYQVGDFSPIAISLFLFAIYGVLVGGLSQMREIVKEKAVYRRERLVNLQIIPYVLSKMWIAVLLAIYQAAAYTILHFLAFDMPGGVLEFFLIYITVVLATLAGMMMGLFASALAPNSNTVPMLVILLMLPQIVLGGALIPLPKTITAITSTRWAFQSFIGITGIASDYAADPCWKLPAERRQAMTLDEKNKLGCLCMGTNVMHENSCKFPGMGQLYDPAIDQPEPAKPAPIGDPPPKPQIPQPPTEPANSNDPIAVNNYVQALKQYQAQVAILQAQYETNVEAYQAKVNQYQQELIQYQQTLGDWQIRRNEAIGQGEAMLARFDRLFGWATVDKGNDIKFTTMLIKTWSAQGIIISILFVLILVLMKMKDRAK